jgi:hypothetical protein
MAGSARPTFFCVKGWEGVWGRAGRAGKPRPYILALTTISYYASGISRRCSSSVA